MPKVKCPQCGKSHEIADDNLMKIIRCACKFNFRPKSLVKTKTPSTKNEKPTILRNSDLDFHQEETVEISNTPSDITDGQINNYISSLQKAHDDIKTLEEDSKEVPIVSKSIDGPIEIDERISIRRQKQLEKEESLQQTEGTDEDSELNKTPKMAVEPKAPSAIPPPTAIRYQTSDISSKKNESWQFWALNLYQKHTKLLISGTISIVVLLGFAVYWISRSPAPVEKPDPYLSQLLKKNSDVSSDLLPSSHHRTKEKHINLKTPPKKTLPLRSKKVPVAVQRVNLYPKLLRYSYAGEYEKLISLAEEKEHLSSGERALYFEARILSQNTSEKKKRQTLEDIKKSKKRNPDTSIFMRAEALAWTQSLHQQLILRGVEQLKSLQLTRPKDALVYAYLGLAYDRLKKPRLALKEWNEVETLEPKLAWVIKKKEAYFQGSNKISKAISEAAALTKVEGQEADGHMILAKLYFLKKNKRASILHYKKSIQYEDSVGARLELGKLLLRRNPKQALIQFEQTITITDNSTIRRNAYVLKARALCRLKKYNLSSAAYLDAFRQDANFYDAFKEKAACEISAGYYSRASRSYQSILKDKPRDAEIWLKYGTTLFKTPKKKAAIAAVQKSIELHETGVARYELANMYNALGMKRAALKQARRAYSLNPHDRKIRRLLGSLK